MSRIKPIFLLISSLIVLSVLACGSFDTAINLTNHTKGTDTGAYWSPDGTKIAFTSARDGNVNIYVMDVE